MKVIQKQNAHSVDSQVSQKQNNILELIRLLFPFHLVFNNQLEIIQLGKNILKIDSECKKGSNLFSHLEIVRPSVETSFDSICKLNKEIFIFSFLENGFRLKGQIIPYEKEGMILFVSSPVVSDGDMFLRYNISLNDFAPYDALPDFLFSMKSQETSFREIQDLVTRLQMSEKKLLQSNEELKQFAYIASHDLQSPLRTVISFAQLLEQKCKSKIDPETKEYLDFIINGTKRMKNLINDLLDYSRVQQSQEFFEMVDIEEVIKEIENDFQYDIKEQNAIIKYSSLPKIYANPVLIKQLFQNLLSNSIKFRALDSPEINISFEEKENEYLFIVKDNGIGFELNEGKRIFEIFQRAVANNAYEGTGIGLAICKKVVDRHKGKIWVNSKPLVGSTFHFTINKFLTTEF